MGLVSGWGRGLAILPHDARAAAAGREVIAAECPAFAGDRLRRATRECLLGVAAVEEAVRDVGSSAAALAGERTALIYATAAAYGAANRAFLEGTGASTLHFPYTAPSAVPAEVAIAFEITGPYVIFLGGGTATLSALWYAATLFAAGQCDRALVLAVETFAECADLYDRARRLIGRPLVEAAACAWLEPGTGEFTYATREAPAGPAPAPAGVRRRLGEAFACTPLVELGAARAGGGRSLDVHLNAIWRGTAAALRWKETGAA
jgi:hypothetical protein